VNLCLCNNPETETFVCNEANFTRISLGVTVASKKKNLWLKWAEIDVAYA